MLLSSLQLLRRSPDEKCPRMLARGTGAHIWRRCKVTLQINHSSLAHCPAPGEQLVAALGALVHPAGEVVLVLLPLPEGGEHCPAAVLLCG